MAKSEWGVKRICPSCGTRYYDMQKDPPVCPSCSTVFDPEALLRSRRARPIPTDDVKKVPKRAEAEALDPGVEEEIEDEVEDVVDDEADVADDIETDDVDESVVDEDADVLLEDADELDDGDDMGEVVDVDADEDR